MNKLLTFTDKLALCWRILRSTPNDLDQHAARELPSYVTDDADDQMQKLMNKQLQELVLVFGTHGHSGFSAQFAIAQLKLLLSFKPLRPLTGEDDEWLVHDMPGCYAQNLRCGSVFKSSKDGQAYNIDGRIFREPNGGTYTNKDSRVYITFPYNPKSEYVDVPFHEHDLYTDDDADRPDEICDSNRQVVLAQCKRCGKAEAELIDHPECWGALTPFAL